VRDMVMQMSGSSGVLSVPNEHLPGLIALVLIGPVLWLALAGLQALAARRVGWADRAQVRLDRLPFAAKVVLFGTLVGAVVHAVIVPTHWRLASVAMLGGTACFYAFYILKGWETMDLVGLLTTTVEAAAALVVLSPAGSPTAARQYAVALAAVPVALVSVLGTNLIAGATTTAAPAITAVPAHVAAATSSSKQSGSAQPSGHASSGSSMPGMPGMSGMSRSGRTTTATAPFALSADSAAGAIN
jgi:hypothetical protein